MPYEICPVKGGFKVRRKKCGCGCKGKAMSNKPLTKEKAEAQMKAILISEANDKKISDKDKERLKDHAKQHKGGMNSKHMRNMKTFMREGDSFRVAHNKAVKIDENNKKKM
tara:strand:- start:513 stop:845 length:333 start_codon:yes stop_codon:yes gene_type:complete